MRPGVLIKNAFPPTYFPACISGDAVVKKHGYHFYPKLLPVRRRRLACVETRLKGITPRAASLIRFAEDWRKQGVFTYRRCAARLPDYNPGFWSPLSLTICALKRAKQLACVLKSSGVLVVAHAVLSALIHLLLFFNCFLFKTT